jgi:DNA repair exonuclease SbcCD ATPase subunit
MAPRLSLTVSQGATVRLDGVTLAPGETARAVLTPLTIEVPGQALIRLTPADRVDADPVAAAEAELAAALAQAGVPDLAAARAAAARREALDRAAREAEARVSALAGRPTAEAVADLAQRAAALTAGLAERLAALGLEAVPPADAAAQELAAAERAAETARADESAAAAGATPAEMAERAAREDAIAAETAYAAALREADAAAAALAAAREREPDAILEARLTERLAIAAARRRDAETVPQADETEVTLVRTRVERLRSALKTAREDAAREREALAAAEAELRALEGDALDEAIAREEAAAARARREADQIEARRAALVLLREAIDTAEREATERYLAPVSQRLQPWLEALLPGARAQLDDRFAVTGLTRDGRDEPFDILSAGTQEQIAVLVRLAFADLLRDQGRAVPVILDDALVFSDDHRIERMFDILSAASERMQIVVLTCRTGLFARLGGHRLTLERVA